MYKKVQTQFYLITTLLGFSIAICRVYTPGEAYHYYLTGEYELLSKNFIEAEKNFKKAHSIAPESPTILQSLADIQIDQGDYDKAASYLKEIHEMYPGDKVTGLQLFQILRNQENTGGAEKILDTLLLYNPNDLDLLNAKSDFQFSNQNWQALLQTYKKIYLLDPENIQLLLKLNEIGLATGELQNVINILTTIYEETNENKALELLFQANIYSG